MLIGTNLIGMKRKRVSNKKEDRKEESQYRKIKKRKYRKTKKTTPGGLPKADHHITIFSNRDYPYIKWIATKKKTAEGRVNSPFFKKLKKNDTVVFYNKYKDYVLCKITYLHEYKNFYAMLFHEKFKSMLPFAKNIEDAENIYLGFPGSNRVKKYGALAIGLDCLKSKYLKK